jgi:methylthioribose-1-phosphate isomerase
MVETIYWKENVVYMLDQRKLPREKIYVACRTHRSVIQAIKKLVIRGAPAIGIAAAMGIALGVRKIRTKNMTLFRAKLTNMFQDMAAARPTAVHLSWSLNRMGRLIDQNKSADPDEIKALLFEEALKILEEDVAMNRILGHHGQKLLQSGSCILTHCNTGALATGGYGTALGVFRAAIKVGKKISVLAGETRPVLQGARLTTWELMEEDIPVTLITDSAAGYFMHRGDIDAVLLGADRIAANGDVANKIGTYTLAVLASAHTIPFYVAAPLSTIDFSTQSGAHIPIEQRPSKEVTHVLNRRIAPEGVSVRNPAFDITPASLITAMITEKGVVRPPFEKNLKRLARE